MADLERKSRRTMRATAALSGVSPTPGTTGNATPVLGDRVARTRPGFVLRKTVLGGPLDDLAKLLAVGRTVGDLNAEREQRLGGDGELGDVQALCVNDQ